MLPVSAGVVLTLATSVPLAVRAGRLAPLTAGEWLSLLAYILLGAGALLLAVLAWRRRKLALLLVVPSAVLALWTAQVSLKQMLDPVTLASHYLTMRDGVRIAIDVYRPRGAAPASLPTILHQTRYHRRILFRWPASLWFGGYRGDIRRFVGSGYAYVFVDARGSGASFGSRRQEWSDDETRDGGEVVSWIVAQNWSSGRVGTTGVSYDGTAAEMTLANRHPAIRAAAPRFSLFDAYTDIAFPGGIGLAWFITEWGGFNAALDANQLGDYIGGFNGRLIRGVAPVDGDWSGDLLEAAIRDHAANYDVRRFISSIAFRDDIGTTRRTIDSMSPFARPNVARSPIPVYSYSGWYDGAYASAAIARHRTGGASGSRLILGPWAHGGGTSISPHGVPDQPIFDQTAELIRFFDYHLRGIANGVDRDAPVRYFTMGEERWRSSASWPPPGVVPRVLYFAPDNGLATSPPGDAGAFDSYRVDPSTSSGTGTRWRSYFNIAGATIAYPDRRERDARLLTYTSEPLREDIEITGQPIITLHVASTAADGQFFAYLEDVAPDGSVTYITEGQLRAVHRRIGANPPYWHVGPYHSFRRADAQPLVPGEPAELRFALLPVSYLVRRGHSIRVALAGADRDQFAIPRERPTWRVLRDAAHPSAIELPLMPVRRTAAPAQAARP